MSYRAKGAVEAQAGPVNDITPLPPSGVSSADDLYLVVITNASADPVSSWPAGFTDLGTALTVPSWAGNSALTVARKPPGTSLPGSYTVSFGSLQGRAQAQLFAFSGRDTGSVVVSVTDNSGSGSTTHNATLTGLTAAAGSDLLALVGAATNSAGYSATAPTGYTEAEDAQNANDAYAVSYRNNFAGGATGSVVSSVTGGGGSDTCGILISIPAGLAGASGDLAATETGSDTLAATGGVGSAGVRLTLRDTDTGALAADLTGLIISIRAASNSGSVLAGSASESTDGDGVLEFASLAIGDPGDYVYVTVEKSDNSIVAAYRVQVVDLNA